ICKYFEVKFGCGHSRYIVREWCMTYKSSHRRCPLHIVRVDFRYLFVFQINYQCIIANS
ncbi:hypothetical protein DL98DRAFT_436606, partial [Cadophora sp. DSE1049]